MNVKISHLYLTTVYRVVYTQSRSRADYKTQTFLLMKYDIGYYIIII